MSKRACGDHQLTRTEATGLMLVSAPNLDTHRRFLHTLFRNVAAFDVAGSVCLASRNPFRIRSAAKVACQTSIFRRTGSVAGMSSPLLATDHVSLRVLTWNIDMGTDFPLVRVRHMLGTIKGQSPPVDVVMLQEVTSVEHAQGEVSSSHMTMIRDRLESTYDVHVDQRWVEENSYYIVMCTRKGLFTATPPIQVTCRMFESSKMGRGYILVEGTSAKAGRLALITSHLESEGSGAAERKRQFSTIVDVIRQHALLGHVVVFGGDTNLREGEISSTVVAKKPIHEAKEREKERAKDEVPGVQRKISDAFIQAGADESKKFTWDMKRNDNLKVDWEFPPASRYDRVFLFGPFKRYPVCTNWDLLGKERLECGVFPSDHWGVLVDIQIPVLPSIEHVPEEKKASLTEKRSPGNKRAKKRQKLNKTQLDANV
jgi:endonuclease/exonuclease/phosphatase family metal-dependent hydrolase